MISSYPLATTIQIQRNYLAAKHLMKEAPINMSYCIQMEQDEAKLEASSWDLTLTYYLRNRSLREDYRHGWIDREEKDKFDFFEACCIAGVGFLSSVLEALGEGEPITEFNAILYLLIFDACYTLAVNDCVNLLIEPTEHLALVACTLLNSRYVNLVVWDELIHTKIYLCLAGQTYVGCHKYVSIHFGFNSDLTLVPSAALAKELPAKPVCRLTQSGCEADPQKNLFEVFPPGCDANNLMFRCTRGFTSGDETDVEVFAWDLAAKLEETPAQVEPVVKLEKEKSTESYSATTLGKGNSNGLVRLDPKAISWDGNASPDDNDECEIANNIVCRSKKKKKCAPTLIIATPSTSLPIPVCVAPSVDWKL
ncbi:hypothetical protein RHGRI_029063 [Rhododendron griersonianum]|uniref:Uncharacterized protein n=1 Tax=Rhododendron griersonianum TaxID=479676 RepID=A0AAV6II59_9ERIC|nr:hypothetical protein RHGRI_029063 [Rhododendron griersonianum]